MGIPNFVKVVEAGPCDGLRNEKSLVSADTKIGPVNRSSEAGFVNMRAASFASSKWAPTMADGADVMAHTQCRPGTLYSALTPNMKGLEGVTATGVDRTVIFSAASEAFVQKNINCTVAGSIERSVSMARAAKDAGICVRGSTSCPLGCPYRGEVSVSSAMDVIRCIAGLGCDGIDIVNTTGVGTAERVKTVMEAVAVTSPIDRLSGHFHGTYGQVLTSILASLEVGIVTFHAPVMGLGDCPYAKGATGDIATEDVLYLLHGSGIRTDTDLDKAVLMGDSILQAIGRPTASRVGRTLLFKLQDQIVQVCI